MAKICCTSYSLRNHLVGGEMTLKGFVELCGDLGMEGVELLNKHFLETGEGYLRQLRESADSLGLEIASVNASNNFAVPDREKLEEQVAHVKKWVQVASRLGAPVVRVFTGHIAEGLDYGSLVPRAIEGFRKIAQYAENYGVTLGVENHGNFCNRADEVLKIVEEVGSSRLKTFPDTGNFLENRYEQLEKVAPLAVHVHAKMYAFDEEGEETTIDYRRVAQIFQRVHYKGYFSIEYGGKGDQMAGVKKGLALLRRCL